MATRRSTRDYLADSPERLSIEMASFTDIENAEMLRDELLEKGYPVRIVEAVSPTETRYNVVIGEFDMTEDAISLAEKLRQQKGFSCIMVSLIGDHAEKVEHHLDELTGS